MDPTHWKRQLRPVIAGRRWLLALDVLAAARGRVRELRALGAARVFVLAGHRGVGELPDPDDAEWVVLGVGGDSMMDAIRAAEAAFADPGPEVAARVDAWDPGRRALGIGAIFSTGTAVCGRPYWGARPRRWLRLEDKTAVDALWDAAGVRRAPSAVVPAARDDLLRAGRSLDRGQGTVWAGDMREGFNGGAEYVRWVRERAAAEACAAFFAAHCDRVRVMPFLDGIPCSIHGMVLGGEVIAFRPCEMIVLRSPGSARFRYASAATFWEPRDDDAAAMREAARRVGAWLRDAVGYRGAFTVDGVLTADGFLPTELNPRVGAALLRLTAGIPDLPLELLHLAAVAGEAVDWRPRDLERRVVDGSRARRSGTASVVVGAPVAERRAADLRYRGGDCVRAAPGEPVDIRLALGPGPAGGFLRVSLDPALTPVGPPAAPRVAAALAWADRAWGLGIGPVSAAPDLRGGPPGAGG